ncbi:transmembrane protein 218-like [Arapaima gigas]
MYDVIFKHLVTKEAIGLKDDRAHMAVTALGVGEGVFILALIWILTLLFGVFLSRTSGPAKFSIVPLVFLALIITLVLVFFPRSSEVPSPVREVQIVDNFFIGRYVLLSVVSVTFLVALFMLLPVYFLEPLYARPLRTP